jgi:hypothetical protein
MISCSSHPNPTSLADGKNNCQFFYGGYYKVIDERCIIQSTACTSGFDYGGSCCFRAPNGVCVPSCANEWVSQFINHLYSVILLYRF